jgi:hypothetical protein
MNGDKFDIVHFVMHFLFGAIIGFGIGLPLIWFFWDLNAALKVIGVVTLVFAILGGFFGDPFWKWLSENVWYRLWGKC